MMLTAEKSDDASTISVLNGKKKEEEEEGKAEEASTGLLQTERCCMHSIKQILHPGHWDSESQTSSCV